MRVQYRTISGKYEGELVNITVPVNRLQHISGTAINILTYDIQILQDDGAKVSFENVKLNDIHAVTNCIKCKHCIIEEDNGYCRYSCGILSPNTGIGRSKTDELHLRGSKCCGFWNVTFDK